MVDIATYRARIGKFGNGYPSFGFKFKTQRTKSIPQVSMECRTCVKKIVSLWVVMTTTMVCIALLYQGDKYSSVLNQTFFELSCHKIQHILSCFLENVDVMKGNFLINSDRDMITRIPVFNIINVLSDLCGCVFTYWHFKTLKGDSRLLMDFMLAAKTIKQRTCSYLIGNIGLHAYNGNPRTNK